MSSRLIWNGSSKQSLEWTVNLKSRGNTKSIYRGFSVPREYPVLGASILETGSAQLIRINVCFDLKRSAHALIFHPSMRRISWVGASFLSKILKVRITRMIEKCSGLRVHRRLLPALGALKISRLTLMRYRKGRIWRRKDSLKKQNWCCNWKSRRGKMIF